MLTIRNEQMRAFENSRRGDFIRRLHSHLSALLGTGRHSGWIQAQIERGMRDAAMFGLVSERNVADFVEINCTYMGGFSDAPVPKPALAILGAYGADPGVKIERYRQWAAAGAEADKAP
jgi:hypothetical protein